MAKRLIYDRWLFLGATLLAVAGLLMVGSASSYYAMEQGRSPSAYYLQHLLHLLLGFGVFLAALRLPYRKLAGGRFVLFLLGCSFVALIAVLAMPPVNGAHRWIAAGPLRLQPSEFAKLVTVFFMAHMLSRKEDQVNDLWKVPVPCMAVVGVLALLVVLEPDLGSAVMLVLAACVMIFVAGLRWKFILAAAAIGIVGFTTSVIAEPYRLERVRAFMNPEADALGSGFQLKQSLIAIGSGGLTGAGLGQGQQKAFYVPAVHTDFILAVIGEELGLIGTLTLLLAFLLIFWRGMRAALRAPDRFGFYLALGITNLLVFQALINMGVCLGLLPTKGLPLPFISYGGSSLLASMAAMGLLINVSQHSS